MIVSNEVWDWGMGSPSAQQKPNKKVFFSSIDLLRGTAERHSDEKPLSHHRGKKTAPWVKIIKLWITLVTGFNTTADRNRNTELHCGASPPHQHSHLTSSHVLLMDKIPPHIHSMSPQPSAEGENNKIIIKHQKAKTLLPIKWCHLCEFQCDPSLIN